MNAHRNLSFLLAAILLASAVGLAQKRKDKSSLQEQSNKLIQQELAFEDKGDFAGAIEVSKAIVQLNPADPRPLNTIAGLYGKMHHFEEEISWAQKAIALDPQFELAYVNYGNALASSGKLAEAKSAFSKAAELNPKDPIAFIAWGLLPSRRTNLTMRLRSI